MSAKHTALVKKGLLALQRQFPEGRFWPVNTGQAWVKKRGGGMRPIKLNVAGIPDIDGYIPVYGLALRCGFEAKVGKDRVRPSQIVFSGQLRQAGGIYVVYRDPVQLCDDATALLLAARARCRAMVKAG